MVGQRVSVVLIRLEAGMFKVRPPSLHEIHQFKYPSNSEVVNLSNRREEIVMASLKGGADIDSAISSADRLIPEDRIKKAECDFQKRLCDWRLEEKRILHNEKSPKSSIYKWWPF